VLFDFVISLYHLMKTSARKIAAVKMMAWM
jgi:hypothetical protein